MVFSNNLEPADAVGGAGEEDEARVGEEALSAEAAAALAEHRASLGLRTQLEAQPQPLTPDLYYATFSEDWQLSQFWYSEECARQLARAAAVTCGARGAGACGEGEGARIALVCCPTLYWAVRAALPRAELRLLDVDRRFALYGADFVEFDYVRDSEGEGLRRVLQAGGGCDLVVADPPFLSAECMERVVRVAAALLAERGDRGDRGALLVCTGAAPAAQDALAAAARASGVQLQRARYRPQHRSNLANDFAAYANFPLDEALASPDPCP